MPTTQPQRHSPRRPKTAPKKPYMSSPNDLTNDYRRVGNPTKTACKTEQKPFHTSLRVICLNQEGTAATTVWKNEAVLLTTWTTQWPALPRVSPTQLAHILTTVGTARTKRQMPKATDLAKRGIFLTPLAMLAPAATSLEGNLLTCDLAQSANSWRCSSFGRSEVL